MQQCFRCSRDVRYGCSLMLAFVTFPERAFRIIFVVEKQGNPSVYTPIAFGEKFRLSRESSELSAKQSMNDYSTMPFSWIFLRCYMFSAFPHFSPLQPVPNTRWYCALSLCSNVARPTVVSPRICALSRASLSQLSSSFRFILQRAQLQCLRSFYL